MSLKIVLNGSEQVPKQTQLQFEPEKQVKDISKNESLTQIMNSMDEAKHMNSIINLKPSDAPIIPKMKQALSKESPGKK